MVDRILFYSWHKVEVDHLSRVNSKTGWSPLPEGHMVLQATFREDSSIAIDKSAWDWTMPAWVVMLYACVKVLQVRNCPDWYQRVVFGRLMEVLGPDCTIRFPSGNCLQQDGVGFMKSGWLLTLSMNSMAQYAQHALAFKRAFGSNNIPLMWAMGDDSLISWSPSESQLERYLVELKQLGCLVKYANRSREFCGFSFNGKSVNPQYKDKHSFLLRHVSDEHAEETIAAYCLLYSLADDPWVFKEVESALLILPEVRAWAKGLPVRLPSIKLPPALEDYY